MSYEIWCNGAKWASAPKTIEEALRMVGKLADRGGLDSNRPEWIIRILKITK